MKDAGVLNNMVMVYGQMNEPPGSRFRVGAQPLPWPSIFGTTSIATFFY